MLPQEVYPTVDAETQQVTPAALGHDSLCTCSYNISVVCTQLYLHTNSTYKHDMYVVRTRYL